MKNKKMLMIIFLITVLCSIVRADGKDSLNRTVITGEELRESGFSLLSDIFMLASEWDAVTVDGFTWRAVPHGLSYDCQPQWAVMLDGQPIDLNVLGTTNINRLPVTLNQIDYVEIISVLQIHEGIFTDGGLIHIHTKKPDTGLSVNFKSNIGNETGDPGPYGYTELRTTNIDRLAENHSFDFRYRRKSIYLSGGIWGGWHFPTDSYIKKRNTNICGSYNPVICIIAPSFKIARETGNSKIEFLQAVSWFEDLFFFKPYGREIPVKSFMAHTGINGSFTAKNNTHIGYRFYFTDNELTKKENSQDLDFNWKQNRLTAEIEASQSVSIFMFKSGFGVNRFSVSSDYELSQSSITAGKIYGVINIHPAEKIYNEIGLSIQKFPEHVSVKGYIENRWDMFSDNAVKARFSYSDRTLAEDNNIWYWSDKGYDFLEDNGVVVSYDGSIGITKTFTGDISWLTNFNNLSMQISGYFRHFKNLYLENRSFQFDPDEYSFYSPVEITANQDGQTGGWQASIKYKFNQATSHRLYYRYQHIIAGDELFKDIWRKIPAHQMRYTLSYRPAKDFSLKAILAYRGSNEWNEYIDINDQTDNKYNSRLAEMLSFDIAFQKWFWQRRLCGNLFFRNILNDEIRYHPIGAVFDLSWFVQISLMLNSK